MIVQEMAPYPKDPRYWVTTEGAVWSTHGRGRWLKPGRCGRGYLKVALGGKTRKVQHMVIETFAPGSGLVLHRNDVPTDNRLENLYLGSRTDNAIDRSKNGGRALTVQQVLAIREHLSSGESGASVARRYSISGAFVSRIKHRRLYSWLP